MWQKIELIMNVKEEIEKLTKELNSLKGNKAVAEFKIKEYSESLGIEPTIEEVENLKAQLQSSIEDCEKTIKELMDSYNSISDEPGVEGEV